METANTAVINSYTGYSNALINRDDTLYNPKTGLKQTAADVKKYVLSVFTAASPQYAQVSALEFKRPKK